MYDTKLSPNIKHDTVLPPGGHHTHTDTGDGSVPCVCLYVYTNTDL